MINSGTPAIGQVSLEKIKRNVASPPSYEQGFGQITLSRVLLFDDDAGTRNLEVYDNVASLFQAEHHLYCFHATTEIKVTLVWNDVPGEVDAYPALVNNLDLFAYDDNSGNMILGNRKEFVEDQTRFQYWDEVNNVEQFEMASAVDMNATLSVYVQARTIADQATQDYSLVVTGEFEVLDSRDCSSRRECFIPDIPNVRDRDFEIFFCFCFYVPFLCVLSFPVL